MEQLEGKVAVVTGAASGIGLALARSFGAEGMRLVLADLDGDGLAAAASELSSSGTEVIAQVTDVSKAVDVEELAVATRAAFGTAHVLCNNAGVGAGGVLWELSEADWQWVLGVNLWGVIHGVRSFVPMLVAQDEGYVVNTASVAGLISAPMMGAYNVSKHGVVTLTETLFNDLRMRGSAVGCSVLCPSWVNTRIWDSARNRPEDLQNESGGALDALVANPEAAQAFFAAAMSPEDVAAMVIDAIRTETFYILTHGDTDTLVRGRLEGVVERTAPRTSLFPS